MGVVLLAASVISFRQHMDQARISKAKLMLATIRNGISMYRYRTGVYPSMYGNVTNVGVVNGLWAGPGSWPNVAPNNATPRATESIFNNVNDLGDGFIGASGSQILDPITGTNSIYVFSTSAGSPPATSSWGGWLYDVNAGTFQINLPGAGAPGIPSYVGDPPSGW